MSRKIELGALTILAGLSATMLAGCSSQDSQTGDWDQEAEMAAEGDWKVCSDEKGNRVADDKCQSAPATTNVAHHSSVMPFFWAYLAARHAPAIGGRIDGATRAPLGGARYGSAPTTGTSRGGFGSSAGRFGGGGRFSGGG